MPAYRLADGEAVRLTSGSHEMSRGPTVTLTGSPPVAVDLMTQLAEKTDGQVG